MGDATVLNGLYEQLCDLVENTAKSLRDLQGSRRMGNTERLLGSLDGALAGLSEQVDAMDAFRLEVAAAIGEIAAETGRALTTCHHDGAHTVVFNDLVDPPGRLSVGWCPNCGAYKRSHPSAGVVFNGKWEVPTGYRRQLEMLHEYPPSALADRCRSPARELGTMNAVATFGAHVQRIPGDMEGALSRAVDELVGADLQALDVKYVLEGLKLPTGEANAPGFVRQLLDKYDGDVVAGVVEQIKKARTPIVEHYRVKHPQLYELAAGEKAFIEAARMPVDATLEAARRDSAERTERIRASHREKTTEQVNHPAHYGGADNPYEAIKVIEAWGLDFCTGNAVKYIARAGKKDPSRTVEDLQKARFYLDREIQNRSKS